ARRAGPDPSARGRRGGRRPAAGPDRGRQARAPHPALWRPARRIPLALGRQLLQRAPDPREHQPWSHGGHLAPADPSVDAALLPVLSPAPALLGAAAPGDLLILHGAAALHRARALADDGERLVVVAVFEPVGSKPTPVRNWLAR